MRMHGCACTCVLVRRKPKVTDLFLKFLQFLIFSLLHNIHPLHLPEPRAVLRELMVDYGCCFFLLCSLIRTYIYIYMYSCASHHSFSGTNKYSL